jgi:hypothetical protein
MPLLGASLSRWPEEAIDRKNTGSQEGADGRQFSCGTCRTLVVICSQCDRGNRYCGAGCAQVARRQSQRGASRRYQRTVVGKRGHAARQRIYRHRRAQKIVTRQGCEAGAKTRRVGRPQTKESALDDSPTGHPAYCEPSAESPAHTTASTASKSPLAGLRACCLCGRWCGPRVRTDRLALCGPRSARARHTPRWDRYSTRR